MKDETSAPPAAEPVAAAREPLIVCLGASAGGLEALQAFFTSVPSDTGAAFVAILHLSPDFKSLIPELLARITSMRIERATHGIRLERDTIYIIPPGKNMVFAQGELLLHDQDRTPGHPVQLPIDIFLRSLAEEAPSRTVGIILSGTGSDGSRGIRALKDQGGIVLAQEPQSARFDGMPRCAIDSGAVDVTGTPEQLAAQVAEIVRHGRALESVRQDSEDDEENPKQGEVRSILDVLRSRLHMDLGYLRPRMLMRRVRRRMALLGDEDVPSYVRRLSSDERESRLLRKDLFIGVTGFFRDELAFERLKAHLIQEVLTREGDETLRVWVPACASGEEAYSLLILLLEAMEAAGVRRAVKLFATDIDEDSLVRAGRATYPASGVAELGPARLARYFVHNGDTVSVQPALREMVICAQHNLVTDPPFTRLDLISCRNFLIYLEPDAQEQVLAALHFALNMGGTLFLGSAEVLGRLETEFEKIDQPLRIFRKTRNAVLPSMRRRSGLSDPLTLLVRTSTAMRESEREAPLRQVLEALVEARATTAALISMDGHLLEVLADSLGVFHVPKGRLTHDIVRLVDRSLSAALTTGLQRLRRGETESLHAIGLGEGSHGAGVRLRRLPATTRNPERVLVVVERSPSASESAPVPSQVFDDDTARHLGELQMELQQTRESLQSTIQELQSSNEEQQSTNEELIASNEELQSTNEELQSVNEELFTVNAEHQAKIQELAVLAADLDNLLKGIDVGTLFLDADLRIRRFTPAIDRIVRLMEHDVGRSFEDFTHILGTDFAGELRRVIASGVASEQEVRGPRGSWLSVRALPYTVASGQTCGVVVTVVDVTGTRNAREMTRVANESLAHANRELARQREELEDLFSVVAHDLKRPVIALDGLLQIAGEAAGEAPELLGRGREECARMRRMLEDLGHVSGLTRKPMPVEPVELQPWLDGILRRFRPAAEERRVRLNVTCDMATVPIPRAALEESLVNLLENALNYGCTSPDPRVDVSCHVEAGNLVLAVRDNGRGIAAEDHQKVFEPFRRLDPELAPGSGLGLVAVRRMVARHGGVVALESERSRGSKFLVRMPIGGQPGRLPAGEAKKPKILLVEDDTLDSRLIQRFLGDTVACTRVKLLAEAEHQLQREPFDLVLLDLSLPDGHGLELVHRMRELTGSPVPIVVVSGHGEGFAPSALSETISGYLSKSEMQRESLEKAVRSALDGARAARPARAEA